MTSRADRQYGYAGLSRWPRTVKHCGPSRVEQLESRRLLALSFGLSTAYNADKYYGVDIVPGNFDGDAYPDLAVVNDPSLGNLAGVDANVWDVRILLNNKNGTFRQTDSQGIRSGPGQSILNPTQRLVVGDFNNDKKTDVAVLPKYGTGVYLSIFLGHGDGTIEPPAFHKIITGVDKAAPNGIATADFNRDGNLDVAISGDDMQTIVLLGDGKGGFSTRVRISPGGQQAVAAGDVNGDGKPDLLLSDGVSHSLNVMLGGGNGNFQLPKISLTGGPGTSILLGDYNGDGIKDVAITEEVDFNDLSQGVRIQLGDGKGNFTFKSAKNPGVPGYFVGAADFNGDFVTDLVVGSIPGNFGSFYTGKGDGSYNESVRIPDEKGATEFNSLRMAIADFNQDGRPDVAANTKTTDGVLLLTNTAVFSSIVAGQVFNDYNANGKLDQVESGLAGWTVWDDVNNNFAADPSEAVTKSAADGSYRFLVPPGTQRLRVVPPDGWTQTTFTVDQALLVKTGEYQVSTGNNIGYTRLGGIAGRVYYDAAADGISNDSDVGVAGVRVYADVDQDGAFDGLDRAAITDATGHYAITGLYPRKTLVHIDTPGGYIVTGFPSAPTTFDPNAFYYNQVFGGFDGGNTDIGVIFPAYVAGTVFEDKDGNGVRGFDDTALPGFQVFIDYNDNGVSDIGEPFTQTKAGGDYIVAASRAGTFAVRIVQRSGYSVTAPKSSVFRVQFVQGTTDVDNNFALKFGAINNAGFKKPLNFKTGLNPVGIATGDFNKDGKADFAVLHNADTGRIYLGVGNGIFPAKASSTFSVGSAPRSLISADLNGDGNIDLVSANQDTNDVSVSLGRGDGTFKAAVSYSTGKESGAYGVVAVDLNGDKRPELAVANSGTNNVAILFNNGNGTFGDAPLIPTDPDPESIAAGDFNKDGKPDLITANPRSNSLSLLINKGNGEFNDAVQITDGIVGPSYVATADFNRDGKLDLVAVNRDASELRVLLGKGNGAFEAGKSYGTGESPQQLVVIDFNQDKIPDLAVAYRSDGTTDISGGTNIFQGKGDGTFRDPVTATAHTSPTAVGLADFDKNGKLDLVVANFFSDDVSIQLNSNAPPPGAIAGFVWNDINRNGKREMLEPGLAGRTIYVDSNNNGKLDKKEPSTTTDAEGVYGLYDLPAGKYKVRQVLPKTWVQAFPTDGGGVKVSIAAGQISDFHDLGQAQTATIAGLVFNDADGNRKRAKKELGLSGWKLFIDRDGDGVLDKGERSVKTDSSGNFRFDNLEPGRYVIAIAQAKKWKKTTPTSSYQLVVAAGQTRANNVFGEKKIG